MLPSTWVSVVFFVLLIAPGLLFDLLAERRRVGLSESAFREASRVVLASLGFSALGLLLIGMIRVVHPPWMPSLRHLFGDPHSYIANNYDLILRALVIEAAVALAAAVGLHWLLARGADAPLQHRSTWSRVFVDERPADCVPHVRAALSSGTVYVGRVAHFAADLELADRELVLAPPLFVKRAGGELTEMPTEWQRVVLPASSIDIIAVQYRRDRSGAMPTGGEDLPGRRRFPLRARRRR